MEGLCELGAFRGIRQMNYSTTLFDSYRRKIASDRIIREG